MSYRTLQARQKIVGLLKAAPSRTLSYQELDDQTDGIPSDVFNEALADLVAADEAKEHDGSYTLLTLVVDQTAPSAAARKTRQREIEHGIPEDASETRAARTPRHGGSGQRARAEEKRAAIIDMLTNARGALPAREIREQLAAGNPELSAGRVNYVIAALVQEGAIVTIGAKNASKYTTPARKAECEQALAELKAQDLRPPQAANQARVRLATIAESPFTQAAIKSGQRISDKTLPPSPGETAMPKNNDKGAAIKQAALDYLVKTAAAVPPKDVFLAVKTKGVGKTKVQKALLELQEEGLVVIAGKGRGMTVKAGGNKAARPSASSTNIVAGIGEIAMQRILDAAKKALNDFIEETLQGPTYDALKKAVKRAQEDLDAARERAAA